MLLVEQGCQLLDRILRLRPRLHQRSPPLHDVAEFFLVAGVAGGLALIGELLKIVGVVAAPLVTGQLLIDTQRLNVFFLLAGDHEVGREGQIAQGVEGFEECITLLESLTKAEAAETALGLLWLLRALRGWLLGLLGLFLDIRVVGRLCSGRIGRECDRREKNG